MTVYKIWVQFGASKKDDIQNLWLIFFAQKLAQKMTNLWPSFDAKIGPKDIAL